MASQIHSSVACYMTTVIAICHNPALRTFYTRLCRRGKPRKVALVAAMRKLFPILKR